MLDVHALQLDLLWRLHAHRHHGLCGLWRQINRTSLHLIDHTRHTQARLGEVRHNSPSGRGKGASIDGVVQTTLHGDSQLLLLRVGLVEPAANVCLWRLGVQ